MPLTLKSLSCDEEILFVENYLRVYLSLSPASDFIDNCKNELNQTAHKIENAFRSSVDAVCYRPLYLSIFTEVWISKLTRLYEFIKVVYDHVHDIQIAEIAALCSANIYTITYKKRKSRLSEEYEKVKLFLRDIPNSMHIRAAYLTVCRVEYLDTSAYRKVPDELLAKSKAWAQQYLNEIEFPEGYFGLLLARLEYAQAHDKRNEQRRLFKEMKNVAERTNYSEYNEENDMLTSIKELQQIYGYQ